MILAEKIISKQAPHISECRKKTCSVWPAEAITAEGPFVAAEDAATATD